MTYSNLVQTLFKKQKELKRHIAEKNQQGYNTCRAEIKALILGIKNFTA